MYNIIVQLSIAKLFTIFFSFVEIRLMVRNLFYWQLALFFCLFVFSKYCIELTTFLVWCA